MTEVTRRKYLKSPIIEVLCEISFEKSNVDFPFWELFHKQISNDYPQKETGSKIVIERQYIEDQDDVVPKIVEGVAARIYNIEESKFIQLTDDEITFNDIDLPYKGFDSFRQDFKNIVKSYIECGKYEYFKRLELRYINEIRFPLVNEPESIELNKYFNYIPKFDEILTNFQFQFELRPHHSGHAVFATLRTIPLKIESDFAFLIDIQNIFLPHNVVTVDNIENVLTQAHENVGRVFERVLTDNARARFKEVENEPCNW